MEVAFVPPQYDAPRRGIVESVEPRPNGSFVVAFDSVADIATAERLGGCFCLVRRIDLPDDIEPEHTAAGFAGFEVHDEKLGFLGIATEARELPGHKLLCVEKDGRELLIPWVDEFILGVSEEGGRITTLIPAGLLGTASEKLPRKGHFDEEGDTVGED